MPEQYEAPIVEMVVESSDLEREVMYAAAQTQIT